MPKQEVCVGRWVLSIIILNLYACAALAAGMQCTQFFTETARKEVYSQEWVEEQLLSKGALAQIQRGEKTFFLKHQAYEILRLLRLPETQTTTFDNEVIRFSKKQIPAAMNAKNEGKKYVTLTFGVFRNALLKKVIASIEQALANDNVTYENYVRISDLARIFLTTDFNVEPYFSRSLYSDIRHELTKPIFDAFMYGTDLGNYNSYVVNKVLSKFDNGYTYVMNLAPQNTDAFLNIFEKKVLFVRVTNQIEQVDGYPRSPSQNYIHDLAHAEAIIKSFEVLGARALLPLAESVHRRMREFVLLSPSFYIKDLYFGIYHESPYTLVEIISAFSEYLSGNISRSVFRSQLNGFVRVGEYFVLRELKSLNHSFFKKQVEEYKINQHLRELFLDFDIIAEDLKAKTN